MGDNHDRDHDEDRGNDVRYVRSAYQRYGAKTFSSKKSHIIPQERGDDDRIRKRHIRRSTQGGDDGNRLSSFVLLQTTVYGKGINQSISEVDHGIMYWNSGSDCSPVSELALQRIVPQA